MAKNRVVDALVSLGGRGTTREIREIVKASHGTVSSQLSGMELRGAVRKIGSRLESAPCFGGKKDRVMSVHVWELINAPEQLDETPSDCAERTGFDWDSGGRDSNFDSRLFDQITGIVPDVELAIESHKLWREKYPNAPVEKRQLDQFEPEPSDDEFYDWTYPRAGSFSARTIEVMRANGGSMSTTEIARAIGSKVESAAKAIIDLKRKFGMVEDSPDSTKNTKRYRLTKQRRISQ